MVRSMEGKHPSYFEATLQLREISPELEEYVRQEIATSHIHVAKEREAKNGIDFELADSDFTKSLGKRLQQKFGGYYLVTAKLYSHKDGRNIYRLTVLFRGLVCKKGDTVLYKGEEYEVKGIGKEITLFGITNPKRIHIKQKDFSLIRLLN